MLTWTKLEPGAYPEDGELILAVIPGDVFSSGDNVCVGIFYREGTNGYGFKIPGGYYVAPVTHWMPISDLPEIPK